MNKAQDRNRLYLWGLVLIQDLFDCSFQSRVLDWSIMSLTFKLSPQRSYRLYKLRPSWEISWKMLLNWPNIPGQLNPLGANITAMVKTWEVSLTPKHQRRKMAQKQRRTKSLSLVYGPISPRYFSQSAVSAISPPPKPQMWSTSSAHGYQTSAQSSTNQSAQTTPLARWWCRT